MRSAALIARDNPAEQDAIERFVNRLYDIRSRIVHGNGVSEKDRIWLKLNWRDVETRVRQILAAALQNLPPGEEDRRTLLTRLYDPSDYDRGQTVLSRFKEIQTERVQRDIAAQIATIVSNIDPATEMP